ncbi:unnamed protein product [Heligmosomoides polygyrus]|uniref:Uncharacterized protein n=1 Tax=Heligmosomoides polygyrus TaxID=6339 RepID=A0A183FSG8_HELPZ|nr:unnamed protein product [Heligmosomoides polygyrus]
MRKASSSSSSSSPPSPPRRFSSTPQPRPLPLLVASGRQEQSHHQLLSGKRLVSAVLKPLWLSASARFPSSSVSGAQVAPDETRFAHAIIVLPDDDGGLSPSTQAVADEDVRLVKAEPTTKIRQSVCSSSIVHPDRRRRRFDSITVRRSGRVPATSRSSLHSGWPLIRRRSIIETLAEDVHGPPDLAHDQLFAAVVETELFLFECAMSYPLSNA